LRKLIASVNITLDGFMAGINGELDWHFPFWTEEMGEYVFRQLRLADTILAGRVTYQKMAAYWPLATRDDFSDMMNNYEKVVFSTSMTGAAWQHTRIVAKNMGEEVSRLKRQSGRDIIIYGSASIVQAIGRMGLIDEYHIWVHPIVIGKGLPLFKNNHHPLWLKLLHTKWFCSGVMLLYYGPEAPPRPSTTHPTPQTAHSNGLF